MKRLCLHLFLALLGPITFGGCGDDDGTGGCLSSMDCPSRLCVDGRCVEPMDSGSTCRAADCDDGNPCDGTETCGTDRCLEGSPAPDGTSCDADGVATTNDYCAAGLCSPGRCGDGVTDPAASEDCDDGNSTNGDGCDACRYSCTAAAACDDANECNGTEACDTGSHACTGGTPLMDGSDCDGAIGLCTAGTCLPRSCTAPEECDDGNLCTGTEACTAMACAAGTPLDCDDVVPCTEDRCDPAAGCSHRLIDMDFDGHAPASLGACGDDCNDMARSVYPGAPDGCDGLDNDCDGVIDEDESVVYWADCDGDGYARMSATSVTACAVPAPGLTGCASGGTWTTRTPMSAATADCNDANATVQPAQTTGQTSPIAGAPPESDFDYNCDGTEQPVIPPTLALCRSIFGCRPAAIGWVGAVPGCGETGTFFTGCNGACLPAGAPRTMPCL